MLSPRGLYPSTGGGQNAIGGEYESQEWLDTINWILFDSDGKSIVEISDEGPGISDEALKTLFDKPQAHDRQSDKTGLSIVKKYVEAMNGKVWCESEFGKGANFIVEFTRVD